MAIKIIHSSEGDINALIRDIKKQYDETTGALRVKLVLFFSSSNLDPQVIGKEMKKIAGDADVFGCTTAGEIVSGKMLKNSLVAMAFDKSSVSDSRIEVLENVSKNINNLQIAFAGFEAYFNISMKDMDYKKYAGVVLIDGLRCIEEKLMERIGDMTNFAFIGASAGDDMKFKETYVFANGKTYTDAAVLALIKPVYGFDILKTQSFRSLNKTLVATKTNEEEREVIEFNNKPAVEAYAEALGISVEQASNRFMENPVGLMIGDEPYVRSPQQIIGTTIKFYCNIRQGTELSLLQSTAIVDETRKALKEKLDRLGGVSAIVNFHCILRTLELENKKQTEDYGLIFSDIPTIGFSTYGEEYIGHINQTSTMLLIK